MKKTGILNFDETEITVSRVELAFYKKSPLGWVFRKEKRGIFALLYVLEGKADYITDSGIVQAGKDDVVFLKKGVSYKTVSHGDKAFEYIVINFDMLPENAGEILPFEMVNSFSHAHRYRELFSMIADKWDARGAGYKIAVGAMVQNLIYELLCDVLSQKTKGIYRQIVSAANYINENYKKKITVSDLADLCGYSISHFKRLFSKTYGMPPIEYLNAVRINRAKELIKSHMYTVGEVARLCGFCNAGHFSKAFKKYTGVSPNKY